MSDDKSNDGEKARPAPLLSSGRLRLSSLSSFRNKVRSTDIRPQVYLFTVILKFTGGTHFVLDSWRMDLSDGLYIYQ